MNDVIEQFSAAIALAGMKVPDAVHGDGQLHRFNPSGKRGDDAGWYVLYRDGVPAGTFGNWRDGYSESWCAKAEHDLTDSERQAQRERINTAQRMREVETIRRHGEAASAALALWEAAAPAVAHPYLATKGVKPYGIRADGHQLFVPMRDTTGKLYSLQTIAPNGVKRFLPGGRVRGCYHAIGRPSGALIICEGYATGATIHQATGEAVAIAFNAGNLQAVAVALRAKYPSLSITIAADDDWKTSGNPGVTSARQAAQSVGGKVAVPDFKELARGDKDTDFNDLHRLVGIVRIGGEA
jgi:putative DNA primase/helicase